MLELFLWGALAGLLPVYGGIGVAVLAHRSLSRVWEGGLIGLATGVLVYLFFDLMHEAVELSGARDFVSWMIFLGSLLVSFVGFVVLEEWKPVGRRSFLQMMPLPYVIALGMGLHNLGEGLAIGASYGNGEPLLGVLLVTGFALHNATEGFGIVGAAGNRPFRLQDILLLGLLAGAPTCLGALLSGQHLSPYFSLAWYSLSAGSLLYVIVTLTAMTYTATRRPQVAIGVFLGMALMYVTAMVLAQLSGIRS